MHAFTAERLLDCLAGIASFNSARLRPLFCGGRRIGWVPDGFVGQLAALPELFTVHPDGIELDATPSVAARSEAVNGAIWQIRGQNWFDRWNDEYAAVLPSGGREPLLHLARCATVPFGVRTYGSLVNGYVRGGEEPRMWVARRHPASDFGGQLDVLTAGFIGAGLTPWQVARRELHEEAGLDLTEPARIVAVSAIRGCVQEERGVRPFAIYCYDLELDVDFVPVNRDGELAGFELLSLEQVAQRLEAGSFKFNAVWVVVDWLMRHGFVAAEGPAFVELGAALRRWDPD